MKSFLSNLFWLLVVVVSVLVLLHIYREPLNETLKKVVADSSQCKSIITYSLGDFDERFGISEQEFLRATVEAEAIWEVPLGREFFAYEPEGKLKLNLVYDYRQGTTQALQELEIEVDQDRASYEGLKLKYENARAELEADKSEFAKLVDLFEARKKTYETEVKRVNQQQRQRQNSISKEEYDRLKAEGDALESEAVALNSMQASIRASIDEVNKLVRALNNMVEELNLNVSLYNETGETFSEEFTQGVYESHGEGVGITVFQFDNYDKLVRVLAHELGHALSLEHVDDTDAIMYRLNQGDNDVLAPSDLSAVKARCGIE